MLLLPAILGTALLLGYALGGRLRNLAAPRTTAFRKGDLWVLSGVQLLVVRLWPVALLAMGMQILPSSALARLGDFVPVTTLIVSYALLIFVAVVNLRLRGFEMILLGLLLNLTVSAANQGMPVSRDALERTGAIEEIRVPQGGSGGKHHLAGEGDVLLPLADVIPIGRPFRVVMSIGDVFAYTGAAVFLVVAMQGPAGTRRYSPRHRAPAATRWGILR